MSGHPANLHRGLHAVISMRAHTAAWDQLQIAYGLKVINSAYVLTSMRRCRANCTSMHRADALPCIDVALKPSFLHLFYCDALRV